MNILTFRGFFLFNLEAIAEWRNLYFTVHICRLGLEAKKEENLADWYSQVSMHSFDFYILNFSKATLCFDSEIQTHNNKVYAFNNT